MNGLFEDHPTNHRVRVGNRKRIVYARYDFDGSFVRYVGHRSEQDREQVRKKHYGGVKVVNILSWWEVHPHEFV